MNKENNPVSLDKENTDSFDYTRTAQSNQDQYMHGNPTMQGGPNMYSNPTMQPNPNMYGNPAMQRNPNMYGNPMPQYTYYGQQSQTNGYGIASLIFGIVSIFASLFYGIGGIILSIPAIALAFISKSQAKQGSVKKMPTIALVGLITGILGFIAGCAVLGLFIYVVNHLNDPNSIWHTLVNSSIFDDLY